MRKNTQQQLGRRFAELRKRAKLTQGEVAQRLKVADATVSRLERGAQWTDFPTLVALCDLYGVEWNELMAIPNGSDPARSTAMQELADTVRQLSIADLSLVRELASAVLRSRLKKKGRSGSQG